MANIPQPNPTQEYKAWFRKAMRRQRKGKEIGVPPQAPFGWGDTGVAGQQAPIQAAPNWDQLYTFQSIGANVKQPLNTDPKKPALHPSEMHWIKKNVKDMTNLSFPELLGFGGFGLVWKARVTKQQNRLELACKIMKIKSKDYKHMEQIGDPDDQQNFLVTLMTEMLQDYNALRDLKHDNIIGFEGLIAVPDLRTGFPWATILLFTELCHGDLWTMLVNRNPDKNLEERETRHWFKHIADAVSYLHEHKITHSDIKSPNIFYVNKQPEQMPWQGDIFQKTFKLGDLGLAICYPDFPGQDTRRAVARGTPGYMPPEMSFRHIPVVDTAKGDVFSLGQTLAESLIGITEFCKSYQTVNQEMEDVMNQRGTYNVTIGAATLVVLMTRSSVRDRIDIDTARNHYWVHSLVNNPRPIRKYGILSRFDFGKIPFYFYPVMVGLAVGLTFLARRYLRR